MVTHKFHLAIRLSQRPVVAQTGNPLFSRESHWDGGSTLDRAAWQIDGSSLSALSRRRSGAEGVGRRLAALSGRDAANRTGELYRGVQSWRARCGVYGHRARPTLLCAARARRRRPIIIGWQQWHPVKWRAALIVGIEDVETVAISMRKQCHSLSRRETNPVLPGSTSASPDTTTHYFAISRHRFPEVFG